MSLSTTSNLLELLGSKFPRSSWCSCRSWQCGSAGSNRTKAASIWKVIGKYAFYVESMLGNYMLYIIDCWQGRRVIFSNFFNSRSLSSTNSTEKNCLPSQNRNIGENLHLRFDNSLHSSALAKYTCLHWLILDQWKEIAFPTSFLGCLNQPCEVLTLYWECCFELTIIVVSFLFFYFSWGGWSIWISQ